jgi:hypothetical protein
MPDLIGEEDALAIDAETEPDTTVLVIAWENAWPVDIAAQVRDLDKRSSGSQRGSSARRGLARQIGGQASRIRRTGRPPR